jgi:hypothetical protein
MKQKSDHTWQVTEPTPIEIGRPATPPLPEALSALRAAVASTGASSIYWFWVSIGGDRPHLGLAVSPTNQDIIDNVGRAVEPVWRRFSIENPLFDILRFGDPDLDPVILEQGQILV